MIVNPRRPCRRPVLRNTIYPCLNCHLRVKAIAPVLALALTPKLLLNRPRGRVVSLAIDCCHQPARILSWEAEGSSAAAGAYGHSWSVFVILYWALKVVWRRRSKNQSSLSYQHGLLWTEEDQERPWLNAPHCSFCSKYIEHYRQSSNGLFPFFSCPECYMRLFIRVRDEVTCRTYWRFMTEDDYTIPHRYFCKAGKTQREKKNGSVLGWKCLQL